MPPGHWGNGLGSEQPATPVRGLGFCPDFNMHMHMYMHIRMHMHMHLHMHTNMQMHAYITTSRLSGAGAYQKRTLMTSAMAPQSPKISSYPIRSPPCRENELPVHCSSTPDPFPHCPGGSFLLKPCSLIIFLWPYIYIYNFDHGCEAAGPTDQAILMCVCFFSKTNSVD